MTKFPAILYKYFPPRLEGCKIPYFETNFQLRATQPSKQNDLYECFPNIEGVDLEKEYVNLPTEYFRKNIKVQGISDKMNEEALEAVANERLKEITDKPVEVEHEIAWQQFYYYDLQVGIISMSKHHNNPVMWGHYGKNDTGFVVGYSLNKEQFLNPLKGKTCRHGWVDYAEKRPRVSDLRDLTQDELARVFSTKYSGWSYENEYRILLQRKDHEEDPTCNSITTLHVSPDTIREIHFGAKISQEVLHSICTKAPSSANLFTSSPSLYTYFHTSKTYDPAQ